MPAPVATTRVPVSDDVLTICAISMLAAMFSDMLHEAVGHALLALLTGAESGLLTTVAWSSTFSSRLVAAGGTLVNLAAALLLWLRLRSTVNASVHLRFFLFMSWAFNLFIGTGYFFFSGVTGFGDWAVVIADMNPRWLWQVLLALAGMASYYGAVLVVGSGLVRYVGVPADAHGRLRKLTILPYISAVLLCGVAGLCNPIGIQLVWQAALPSTAGANSGLLWMRYAVPDGTVPDRAAESIGRSHLWIAVAAVLALVFIFVLGRGITVHR